MGGHGVQERSRHRTAASLLGRSRIATRFRSKRNQQQPQGKSERGHRDGSSERAVMPHTGSDKKSNSSARKAGERSRKSKGAGAAFRGILFRQPKSVDGEVRTPQP